MRVLVLCAMLVMLLSGSMHGADLEYMRKVLAEKEAKRAQTTQDFRCGKNWITIPLTYQSAPFPKQGEEPKWHTAHDVITWRKSMIRSVTLKHINLDHSPDLLEYIWVAPAVRNAIIKCLD